MNTGTIIVIGASSGGFSVLQQLIAALPPDLPAALFVVWHMPPDGQGILPEVFNRAHTLPAAHAIDGEAIETGRIFVAPPDHHLLVERGHVRVTKGPKEHRFRPAVDPLFRSAASAYGPQVIGVVLSGALDDGSAGLRTIKRSGGTAIVQDPQDADVPSMPRNAMQATAVDYVVTAAELAALLVRLSHERDAVSPEVMMDEDTSTMIEIRIAAGNTALEAGVLQLGAPTLYTCPDCHGVLLALKDDTLLRFRCHTGHAFSANSLLEAVTAATEDSLWSSVRSLEECLLLLNHLGDHLAETHRTKLAALYYQQANATNSQAQLIRQALAQHERLSAERLQHYADALGDDEGTTNGQSQ